MKFRVFLFSLTAVLLAACAAERPDEPVEPMAQSLPAPERIPHPPVTLEDFEHNENDLGRQVVTGARISADVKAYASPRNLDSLSARNRISSVEIEGAGTVGKLQRHAAEPLYREQYERPADNGVFRVSDVPVSTFSIDVDTGAYSNTRRWLNQGQLPPQDAVRAEEFINYFDYDYPLPETRNHPFLVSTEVAPTPWNSKTHLVRIGIQGFRTKPEELPEANLVFLIDVSGSMRSPDKLGLLKNAMAMLTRNMDANDHISIVVYAGASGVVLEPTAGDQQATILAALDQLQAGGSTNGGAGIRLAYQMAEKQFRKKGVNRVLLATDGDFNVGLASHDELIDLIERKRDSGIALTTLGFGSGNFNDHLLEQLADSGNGNYAYIDRLNEAQKVLSEELSATLLTIARDVKIQIEFNPQNVSEYRLIGYENRMLNEEDFNNDKIDAGDIGAGHRVTALYEVSFTDTDYKRLSNRRYANPAAESGLRAPTLEQELAHLKIRYKQPGQERSQLIETAIMKTAVHPDIDSASNNLRFAASVAAFAQKLRGGAYLEDYAYEDIRTLAAGARGADAFGYRGEFLQLIALADSIDGSDRLAQERSGE